jgi:hypothetical protein
LINEEIMTTMYYNEGKSRKPIIGERVTLVHFAIPICGGSCDYPFGFKSGDKDVYVPNGSVLMCLGRIYQIKVESSREVEVASEFGVHKNGFSISRLKRGRLENIFPELLKDRKFRFVGVSPQ